MRRMRSASKTAIVLVMAMDRFRWLGLGPEEFWRSDPENVRARGGHHRRGDRHGHRPGGLGLVVESDRPTFVALIVGESYLLVILPHVRRELIPISDPS